MTYGYARVSTVYQNEDRQLSALKKEGVLKKNIYVDKKSGKDFDRPKFLKLLNIVKSGDLIIIKSIDRLGRNYKEIQNMWRIITKEKDVDIYVIDMPLLDTRCGKDLIGTFISDLVLQLLSFVAENERINIKSRQSEGIILAKQRGVRFGRPPKEVPSIFNDIVTKWKLGEITGTQAAKLCNMPLSTFRYKANMSSNNDK